MPLFYLKKSRSVKEGGALNEKTFLLLFSSLLLVACVEKENEVVQNNKSENIARVEDFSDAIFKNDETQFIIFKDNKVAIEAHF